MAPSKKTQIRNPSAPKSNKAHAALQKGKDIYVPEGFFFQALNFISQHSTSCHDQKKTDVLQLGRAHAAFPDSAAKGSLQII